MSDHAHEPREDDDISISARLVDRGESEFIVKPLDRVHGGVYQFKSLKHFEVCRNNRICGNRHS